MLYPPGGRLEDAQEARSLAGAGCGSFCLSTRPLSPLCCFCALHRTTRGLSAWPAGLPACYSSCLRQSHRRPPAGLALMSHSALTPSHGQPGPCTGHRQRGLKGGPLCVHEGGLPPTRGLSTGCPGHGGAISGATTKTAQQPGPEQTTRQPRSGTRDRSRTGRRRALFKGLHTGRHVPPSRRRVKRAPASALCSRFGN